MSQDDPNLWLNAAQCLRCFDVIESTYRHDFRRCECGALCVDGGEAYLRRLCTTGVEYVELSFDRRIGAPLFGAEC